MLTAHNLMAHTHAVHIFCNFWTLFVARIQTLARKSQIVKSADTTLGSHGTVSSEETVEHVTIIQRISWMALRRCKTLGLSHILQ